MLLSFGILLILCGLAIAGFGLFIFYAWLPVLYMLFGLDIGLMLGNWVTGEMGWFAILLGVAGAVLFGCMTFVLEPYRRILVGASGGVVIGLALAYTLGLDRGGAGLLGALLVLAGGIGGGLLVARLFDVIVIGASAFGGAVMAMAGAHMVLPGVQLFDRAAGGIAPRLITLVLAGICVHWQLRHIGEWVRPERDAASGGEHPRTF